MEGGGKEGRGGGRGGGEGTNYLPVSASSSLSLQSGKVNFKNKISSNKYFLLLFLLSYFHNFANIHDALRLAI